MKEFIDDYAWLFDKNGNVDAGKKVAYLEEIDDWYKEPARKVVTLAGYRPYYTDGTPDPTNEDVNDWNYIEVNGDVEDSQIRLTDLYEIHWYEEPKEMLLDCEIVMAKGYAGDYTIIDNDKLVETDELEEVRHIADLSLEECTQLALQVGRGSMYVSDYTNTLCVPAIEVSNASDSYYEEHSEEEDDGEWYDTADSFADYLYNSL